MSQQQKGEDAEDAAAPAVLPSIHVLLNQDIVSDPSAPATATAATMSTPSSASMMAQAFHYPPPPPPFVPSPHQQPDLFPWVTAGIYNSSTVVGGSSMPFVDSRDASPMGVGGAAGLGGMRMLHDAAVLASTATPLAHRHPSASAQHRARCAMNTSTIGPIRFPPHHPYYYAHHPSAPTSAVSTPGVSALANEYISSSANQSPLLGGIESDPNMGGSPQVRKVTHSVIERRRREKMNSQYALLRMLIPASVGGSGSTAIFVDPQQAGSSASAMNIRKGNNKLDVLELAVEYIAELRRHVGEQVPDVVWREIECARRERNKSVRKRMEMYGEGDPATMEE